MRIVPACLLGLYHIFCAFSTYYFHVEVSFLWIISIIRVLFSIHLVKIV